MTAPKIMGIVLVRNEDLFVERAVRNIASFCDSLILCEHGSTDGTLGILEKLASEFPHAELHRIKHPSESHDLLKPFAGTRTWVFAVDGDEIYDPERLRGFRSRILTGEFDHIWRMKGNVLHCTAIAPDYSTASGFMSPPSRSMTQLYNSGAITAWDGNVVERLHGGNICFKPGFHDPRKDPPVCQPRPEEEARLTLEAGVLPDGADRDDRCRAVFYLGSGNPPASFSS